MILENKDKILKLDNCPLQNEEKTIKLYRLSENNPIENVDLVPYAVSNPERHAEKCLAWGLSFYNTLEATRSALNGMPTKRRKKIKAVMIIEVDKTIAIKHKSGENKNHYTVYPYQNVDFISKFTLENIL